MGQALAPVTVFCYSLLPLVAATNSCHKIQHAPLECNHHNLASYLGSYRAMHMAMVPRNSRWQSVLNGVLVLH